MSSWSGLVCSGWFVLCTMLTCSNGMSACSMQSWAVFGDGGGPGCRSGPSAPGCRCNCSCNCDEPLLSPAESRWPSESWLMLAGELLVQTPESASVDWLEPWLMASRLAASSLIVCWPVAGASVVIGADGSLADGPDEQLDDDEQALVMEAILSRPNWPACVSEADEAPDDELVELMACCVSASDELDGVNILSSLVEELSAWWWWWWCIW